MTFSAPRNLTGATGIKVAKGDDHFPIVWAAGPKFSLTGTKADGVYVWSGINGKLSDPAIHLGPGTLASPAGNSVQWLTPDGVAMYAYCE